MKSRMLQRMSHHTLIKKKIDFKVPKGSINRLMNKNSDRLVRQFTLFYRVEKRHILSSDRNRIT